MHPPNGDYGQFYRYRDFARVYFIAQVNIPFRQVTRSATPSGINGFIRTLIVRRELPEKAADLELGRSGGTKSGE